MQSLFILRGGKKLKYNINGNKRHDWNKIRKYVFTQDSGNIICNDTQFFLNLTLSFYVDKNFFDPPSLFVDSLFSKAYLIK